MHSEKQQDQPQHKHETSTSGLSRVVSGTLVAGFLITAVLLAGLILTGEESEPVPAMTAQTTAPAPATPAVATPALSPRAQEDLRADPAISLTIDPEPLLLEPLPIEAAEPPADDIAATDEDTLSPPEAPFSVGEALARYLLAIRSELNSEYVANCIRHRNRNGAGAECPDNEAFTATTYQQEQALVDELFAIITRDSDAAQISSRLERENQTLAALLEDPANPAALQASTRLALNNSYLAYLNGNPSPEVAAFNTMNDFINDYNRTIRVGPVQFRCQDGPCVYAVPDPDMP